MLRELERTLRRPAHVLHPESSQGLVNLNGGRWSIGNEGAVFALRGTEPLPSGWVLLDLPIQRDASPQAPRLLVDTGDGFAEATAIVLPFPGEGRIRTLLRLPDRVLALGLALGGGEWVEVGDLEIREIGSAEAFALVSAPVVRRWLAKPSDLPRAAFKLVHVLGKGGPRAVMDRLLQKKQHEAPQLRYAQWRRDYDTLTGADRAVISAAIERLPRRPLLSVVMPVYETPERWLRAAIASVRRQRYPHWELCIADDASKSPHVRAVLEEAARLEPRIRITMREENGHIPAASNSALALAAGEFIVLLDHDDELSEHALFVLAREICAHPDVDLIYSDEDKLDERGEHYDPFFKPDWNPDLFLSQNYVAHLCALRASRVREVGGFREGFEGSQDYDLYLRVIGDAGRVRHVPHVLYHWRAIEGSTARETAAKSYAETSARRALQEHLDRRGARVQPGQLPTTYRVRWPIPEPAPLVSLIIPTRNGRALLEPCIESLLRKTRYRPFEILVVDNQSTEPDALDYLRSLERRAAARVLRYDKPFNFSAINNFAAGQAAGTLLGLLNNDLEVFEEGWLEEMVSHALRPEIGAVGARLLYSDRTLQHGGVILGIGGIAGHAHKHLPSAAPGYFSRAQLTQDLSAVTAACLVVRRSTFLDVGGLDEGLPVAFNDIDFCLRLRQSGLRNLWTPYATLLHHESKSRGAEDTRQKRARFLRESATMEERWGASLRQDPAYNPNLTLDAENFSLAWPPRVDRTG